MFDSKGRIWFTVAHPWFTTPAFCRKGSDHPSAKLFPVERAARAAHHVRSQDREVHHRRHLLQHASSAISTQRRFWTSSGGGTDGVADIVGWSNPPVFDATGDEQNRRAGPRCSRHQQQRQTRRGLCRAEPADHPAKDKRIVAGFYGVAPSPADNTSGDRCSASPARSSASIPATTRRRPCALGNLRAAAARLFAARSSISTATASSGCHCPAATRELRPPQVQGPAQRPHGDRQAVPGRLDALSLAGADSKT